MTAAAALHQERLHVELCPERRRVTAAAAPHQERLRKEPNRLADDAALNHQTEGVIAAAARNQERLHKEPATLADDAALHAPIALAFSG